MAAWTDPLPTPEVERVAPTREEKLPGITFGMEETFRPYLERGELVPMLEDYSPSFAGFYLYYPSRRNLAPKLRAFIDHVRLSRER